MAQNTTVVLPAQKWTQLTDADAASVTFQNIGQNDVLVMGRSSAAAPETSDGALLYEPNQGEKLIALATLFPGVTTPVRLYAYSGGGSRVMISHA
jgi:hypothetical protein